jgi:hypothetical protein
MCATGALQWHKGSYAMLQIQVRLSNAFRGLQDGEQGTF